MIPSRQIQIHFCSYPSGPPHIETAPQTPVLCTGVLGHGPSALLPVVAMVFSHATSHACTAEVESQPGSFTVPGGLALQAGSAATFCHVGEVGIIL